MKLWIAGKDRSTDIGPRLIDKAADRRPIKAPPPGNSALSLLQCRNAEEYVDRFYHLLRIRAAVDLGPDPLPLSRHLGIVGRLANRARVLLWKLLRTQHDRMTLQQNMINELLVNALDFQQSVIRDDLAGFRARLDAIDEAVDGLRRRLPESEP